MKRWKVARDQILGRPADPLGVLVSYVVIRNGIGVLGLTFPVLLVVGGGIDQLQGSLSAYYHFSAASPTRFGAGTMRDAFVGILCAIGAFLLFYRGHSLQEDIALNLAGVSAALVALVPMDWPPGIDPPSLSGRIHSGSATAFFLMIGYVCIFRAKDTLCIVADPTLRRTYEHIYLAIGSLMLSTPAAIAAVEFVRPAGTDGYATLLIEIVAVVLFSSFWLIKNFEIRSSLRSR